MKKTRFNYNILCRRTFYITLYSLIITLFTSCVDTVLLPDDKTVDEDFWQNKNDVQSMVTGAYKSMLATSVMQRLIIWGDFRSDELLMGTPTGTLPDDLEEIEGGAIETDNQFNNWAGFYSVINNCNIVLSKAEDVMTLDPNYTKGDYLADRSQMLSLRALCYFYLVRAFRDVPYVTEPYMNSSQDMDVMKSAPDSVLTLCIKDLEEAETNALDPSGYDDWRRTGFITRDGVDAILADIYLWLASVKSPSDAALAQTYYEKCISYCDKIIDSKNKMYSPQRGETLDATDTLHLSAYNKWFADMFSEEAQSVGGHEEIFTLQFSSSNSNEGLCQMYHRYTSSGTPTGYCVVPTCYGIVGSSLDNNVYGNAADTRFTENIYSAGSSSLESFFVRKMVEQTALAGKTTAQTRQNNRTYANYAQNWIVYRLTDIMLMKAEALVQLTAGNNDDVRARQAFNIVQAIDTRALPEANKTDSIKWTKYQTTDLEALVLGERARELSFEGKRWFDLLRYNYRHVEGVDYSKTLNQIASEGKGYVTNYTSMMTLMTRKYTSGASAVKAKMPSEPYLYMPVYQSEMDVNKNLEQNPVYSSNKDWVKDY